LKKKSVKIDCLIRPLTPKMSRSMAYYLIRIPKMNYFCCKQILPRVSLVFLLNNKDTKFFKSHHLFIKNNLLKIFKNSKIGPKIGVFFYFWKEVRSRSYSSRSNFYYYYYFFAFQCMGSRPHSTFKALTCSTAYTGLSHLGHF